MIILNIEIKARCPDPERVRAYLRDRNARFVGEDHQIDTYFNVPDGRLKLRQGTIEQSLIQYRRPDLHGPKQSDVVLHPADPATSDSLREALTAALGVKVVVDKRRHIFFIDNVKFHIDEVEGLGAFMEIEAIDREGTIGAEALRAQCNAHMQGLGIEEEHLLSVSYSDLLLAGGSQSA